jgi:hypothetical protein
MTPRLTNALYESFIRGGTVSVTTALGIPALASARLHRDAASILDRAGAADRVLHFLALRRDLNRDRCRSRERQPDANEKGFSHVSLPVLAAMTTYARLLLDAQRALIKVKRSAHTFPGLAHRDRTDLRERMSALRSDAEEIGRAPSVESVADDPTRT